MKFVGYANLNREVPEAVAKIVRLRATQLGLPVPYFAHSQGQQPRVWAETENELAAVAYNDKLQDLYRRHIPEYLAGEKPEEEVIATFSATPRRPEEMRVLRKGPWFLVQTQRPGHTGWVTQKEHRLERGALADAAEWY